VAFSSAASDLVANDTNGEGDVFVRDLQTGTTTLVSVNKAGTNSGNGDSVSPKLSANGRFVGFWSYASDLVATTIIGLPNVFVRDLNTGITTLVSANNAGTGSGNGVSYIQSRPSADGRFVAFESFASDLLARDTNGANDVFVRDLRTGTTTLVSVNRAGTDSGHAQSTAPSLSADSRFVGFFSQADDLALDTHGTGNAFVRDLQTGTTTLVSVNRFGSDGGNHISGGAVLSADGRFATFVSDATDLVATDTNGTDNVFAAKITTNASPVCSTVHAVPTLLWSPNHQFVPIAVKGVTDPDGNAVTITVTGVTQDEPVNAKGDGNTSPDAVIQAGSATVRAERSGNGNGRVYQLSFRADDGQGGFCTGAVTVSVPHSQKKGLGAIDDGQIYDSTVP
jgi:hypothetical protein